MTKQELADRIKQIINISKLLITSSNKLKELHDKYIPQSVLDRQKYKTSEISLLIRFLHCTFYYEVLLNLNTLLNPLQNNPDKKEQSIFELIEFDTDKNRKKSLLVTGNSFRKKLEEKNLHKWRNKFVGHKDIDDAGDTEAMYLNFIKSEFINCTNELLENIDKFIIDNYDVCYNNRFVGLYSKSFERLFAWFEDELKIKN